MVGKEGESQRRLLTLLLTTAFAVSVLFLFGPIQMYIVNLTELWFPITDVLWPTLIAFILTWAVVFAVGFLLSRWEKIFAFYCSVIWGLGLALYIQGNFIPFTYGILDGDTIDWEAHHSAMLLNAFVWGILLVMPFILHRFLPKYFDAIVRYSSCGLIFVQLIAVVLLCVTTDFSQTAVSESYLSDEGLYEVSDEQNVIIFILDTYDQKYFQEIYEDDPDFTGFLDGFTYFNNMSGTYPITRTALPYIFTGEYYKNEQPYSKYINEAWSASSDYYQILMDNGFDIRIYTDLETAISSAAKQAWIQNTSSSMMTVSSYTGLESSMLRFTAMRFFPDSIKRYIWEYGSLFDKWKSAAAEDASPFVSGDTSFYTGLIQNGLTAVPGKRYQFIHLDGTHKPYTVLEDVSESVEGGATEITEAKGCLTLLKEYIRQLKELDVYDQTCMIITGDHGFHDELKTNPILLIKGFAESRELQFSDAPVSHANLMGTVMEELGIRNTERFGQSAFETDGASTQYRQYFYYTNLGSWDKEYLPDMYEYYVLPDGNDPIDFILTGRVYTSAGMKESIPYQYEVGKKIVFDRENEDSLAYFLSGIMPWMSEGVDGSLVWSAAYSSRACFHTGEIEGDLSCHIRVYGWVPTDSQRVKIRSQNVVLYDSVVTSDMPYLNFTVPKHCVQDGLLVLDFEYPDACSPKSIGVSEDDHILSIGFKEILFTEQEETKQIEFSKDGNGGDYFYRGWHALSDTWSWTNETASIQAVLPSDQPQEMLVNYWTHPGAKDTSVYYNGEYVGTLPHHDETEQGKVEVIILPLEYKADTDVQQITFVTDGATTSKEYYGGDVTDSRVLGIAVSKIQFRYPCTLDEPIVFNSREAAAYFRSGAESYAESFSDGEFLVWTLGSHSQACFPVNADVQNLTCCIRVWEWMPTGAQTIVISSQGKTLYSGVATADMTDIQFTIPEECCVGGQIVLDFEHPDACSPKSLGISEDGRPLALGFREILFTGG